MEKLRAMGLKRSATLPTNPDGTPRRKGLERSATEPAALGPDDLRHPEANGTINRECKLHTCILVFTYRTCTVLKSSYMPP